MSIPFIAKSTWNEIWNLPFRCCDTSSVFQTNIRYRTGKKRRSLRISHRIIIKQNFFEFVNFIRNTPAGKLLLQIIHGFKSRGWYLETILIERVSIKCPSVFSWMRLNLWTKICKASSSKIKKHYGSSLLMFWGPWSISTEKKAIFITNWFAYISRCDSHSIYTCT